MRSVGFLGEATFSNWVLMNLTSLSCNCNTVNLIIIGWHVNLSFKCLKMTFVVNRFYVNKAEMNWWSVLTELYALLIAAEAPHECYFLWYHCFITSQKLLLPQLPQFQLWAMLQLEPTSPSVFLRHTNIHRRECWREKSSTLNNYSATPTLRYCFSAQQTHKSRL